MLHLTGLYSRASRGWNKEPGTRNTTGHHGLKFGAWPNNQGFDFSARLTSPSDTQAPHSPEERPNFSSLSLWERAGVRGDRSPTRLTRRRLLLGASGLPLVLLAACGDSDEESQPSTGTLGLTPKQVTFMAGFKPQANLPFVASYVAQEKGFFKEQALEVEIRHAQSGEHLQLLLAGEIQFATANGAQVLARNAQGLEIVSIALIGQKSEQVFAVAADSNIRTVKDWEGKTFGYPSSVPAEFLATVKANGVDAARINQVRAGNDPRILAEGRVDILSVFVSNEPDTLERLGFRTRLFDPGDYGVPSLGLTFIASRDYLSRDPEVAGRFVKAALKGLDYANANRDEAVNIVMKYAPQEEREHQRYMLNKEFDRGALTDLTRKNGLGWQTPEQWQALHETLLEFKTIEKPVDVSRVFNDEFVRASYRDGKLVWP